MTEHNQSQHNSTVNPSGAAGKASETGRKHPAPSRSNKENQQNCSDLDA
ncbi:hypothetical protein SFR_2633 [Streptomyces sp. FR-008]|nr:hypothetical protein SFR_2633 [Streptomyces sp. FR-008]